MKIFYLLVVLYLLCIIVPINEANSQPLQISVTVTQQACQSDGEATVTVSGGTPPYRIFLYSDYVDRFNNNLQFNGTTITNMEAGTYEAYVLDTLDSLAWFDFECGVVLYDSITKTLENCNHHDGTITAVVHGGSMPYEFEWNIGYNHLHYITNSNIFSNSNTLSGLGSNHYGIMVTEANGCYIKSPVDSLGWLFIYSVSPVTVTASTLPCNCNDGSATAIPANGTPPYSYFWDIIPPQYGQTASGLDAFTSMLFYVTDSVGCRGDGYAYITPGPDYIETNENLTWALCPLNNGAITLIPSGGTPPYSMLWSTGDTGTTISNLPPGHYTCEITDSAGCTVYRTKIVSVYSHVMDSVHITEPNCGLSNGIIEAFGYYGTSPYTYEWSDSQIGPIAYFGAGTHCVLTTDANGCSRFSCYRIDEPDSCYAMIQGTTWHDINGDCVVDNNEYALPYPEIVISPDMEPAQHIYCGIDGTFFEKVYPGTYSVLQNVPSPWTQRCPAANPIIVNAVAGAVYTIDIFDQPDSIFDDLYIRSAFCHDTLLVRGHQKRFQFYYSNNGNTKMDGSIAIHLDPKLIFLRSQPLPDSVDTVNHIYFYFIDDYLPRYYDFVSMDVDIPAALPIGDTIINIAEIRPITTDARPLDNVDTMYCLVVGSYDPNFKVVQPTGNAPDGAISSGDSILTYTVNFQNVGTYEAIRIRVIDTLDNNLDPQSVHLIATLPRSEVFIEVNGQIITFDFLPTYLPDSINDELGSHGFVVFTVKLRPGLSVGTTITNSASIVFDANTPVKTNEVLNTIQWMISVPEIQKGITYFDVFPNPIRNRFQLSFNLTQICQPIISIYNLFGSEIYKSELGRKDPGQYSYNFSEQECSLSDGIYIVQLSIGDERISKKMVCISK